MVIAFPSDVLARLRHIEASEDTTALEVVHQAVAVWTMMTAEERRVLGLAALRLVVDRLRDGGGR